MTPLGAAIILSPAPIITMASPAKESSAAIRFGEAGTSTFRPMQSVVSLYPSRATTLPFGFSVNLEVLP
ncbi:hypothetical protein PUR_42060 [Paenibacillus sp. URB8-2]|nr:hypothetical protein PUR_42060 [Paenibacillus sp. URB8-2]